MFDELKKLVETLEAEPIKNYRCAKERREILQLIKVEAQRLRGEIQAIVKSKSYIK